MSDDKFAKVKAGVSDKGAEVELELGNQVPGVMASIFLPIARIMGPGFGIFARYMGPPNRQQQGARIAGEEGQFARSMGPPHRQQQGASG